MSHTHIFTHYFNTQFWGNRDGSSGPNSAYEQTPLLRQNLQRLIDQLKIKKILDAGCGDANIIRYLNLTGIDYLGIECVEALTLQNQQNFADHPHMRFSTQDIVATPLPATELIICRDVVHYLPNELIRVFLKNILQSEFTYLLITHNTAAPVSANSETEVGIFRPVNLTQKPFHLPPPLCTIAEDVAAKELALWKYETLCTIF